MSALLLTVVIVWVLFSLPVIIVVSRDFIRDIFGI
jgi:uncharacterized membrane protein